MTDQNLVKKSSTVIKITQQQVLDYVRCPNYFYFKYLTKIPDKTGPTFHSLIKTIINYYFSALMDNKVPSDKEIKNRWDKMVEKYPLIISNDKLIMKGYGLLNLFIEYCYKNRVLIADIDSPYQINVSSNTILTGQTGAVRLNEGKLELFEIETSQKAPDQTLLNMSLKYTMQIYALRELSIAHPITNVRILHLSSGKEFTTYRTNKDFDRLTNTLNKITKAIRNEIYYPREDYMCPQCSFKTYCGFT